MRVGSTVGACWLAATLLMPAMAARGGDTPPVVLGPVQELAVIDEFGAGADHAWTPACGQNVAYRVTPGVRLPGVSGTTLEVRVARKDLRDPEPGHNWLSLARKDVPAGAVPEGMDGFRFQIGSRGEAQWWISATLTTDDGQAYSHVLADHTFPACQLVDYQVPVGEFETGAHAKLTPEKARAVRGISFAVSSAGTSLLFHRIATYRRERLTGWLDFATSHPTNNLFQRTDRVSLRFTPGGTPPAGAAGFRYEVRDYDGVVAARGAAGLDGRAMMADATPRAPGYYEVRAFWTDAAGKDLSRWSCIRAEGTVPDGLGTFAVLPHTLAENTARMRRLGSSAFLGLHGDFLGLADYVGLTWRFGYTGWQYLEPTRPDRSSGTAPWAQTALAQPPLPAGSCHILPFTLNLGEGAPAWARSTDGAWPGFAWDDALAMVRDSVKVEKRLYPALRPRLYGGLWEVDLNAQPYGVHKPDYGPDQIADAYRRIHEVVAQEDPGGVVIGPCSSIIRPDWFEAVFKAGVLQYVGGIETHGYADGKFTPEADDLAGKIQRLNALVRKYNDGRTLPIYITELGQPGVLGADVIARSQTERMVRAAVMLKGEGVRVFLPFYGIDYDRAYFGFMYNLDVDAPSGPWATKRTSPKPLVNAMATCVDMLEGATPRGRLRTLGPDVWAYAFDRGGARITAVWCPAGRRTVALPVGRGRSAQVVDMMGRAHRAVSAGDVVRLQVSEAPSWVVEAAGPVRRGAQ